MICLVLLICTLTIWSSVLCVLMVKGMSVVVNVMLSLMSVTPPSTLCNLSGHTVVKLCTFCMFDLGVSFMFWIVMKSACLSWKIRLSSSSLFIIPFMLTYSMIRFLSFLLLRLCPCVVSVGMWSSLVCLWVCLGTLCRCRGCCDCNACTVVCVACVYTERVWGCEGDGNAGARDGWCVVVLSAYV